MRSSVSYMLSHGPGEPIMSHPDYEQHAHHHGCLLVLIRGIGTSKPRSLQRIFERIQHVDNIKIKDSTGLVRDVWIRYVRDHPVENNDWGDFQTHRRLLGLITVGKFDTQTDLNELCRIHESLKVKYTNTLYDSRCILFASKNHDKRKEILTLIKSPETISSDQETSLNKSDDTKLGEDSLEIDLTKPFNERFQTPTNFKSRAFFYPENDQCTNLEVNISEFISSLFWILESKRLERSKEKIDKVSLLLAPFEKKDFIGLDLESRNNRKRCMGRATKHLGDLTLQSGLINESLNLFQAASETLRAISDSLWLGAANEGLCSASAILHYPTIRNKLSLSLQRNSSLPEHQQQQQKELRSPEKDRKKSTDFIRTLENTSTTVGGDPLNVIDSSGSSSNSSSTSSVASTTTNSTGSSSTTTSSQLPSNILAPDEITNKYRDAIINYSKYRHAGIIETEAALKAARICIEQNQNLDVSMFLQNVLYINLNMSEQQRVKRFETLTELYQQIGYHRKASFCQRLAAWRHVAQNNPNPDWEQNYRLMIDSFTGHNLTLDPIDFLQTKNGWPCLQIDLLQQLIVAAKRLGQHSLAIRHMTFLLQTMWKHLPLNEQKEFTLQLQNLSVQCEGSPVPLVLDNGIIIPPSNLTDLPICTKFTVNDLETHLRPMKILVNKIDPGPFLFTPIHFSNSLDRRLVKKNDNQIKFNWLQNDIGSITIKLENPLPFELKINDMRLLTNGIVFESQPQTIVLHSLMPTFVTLYGTPIEYGELEIQGYSTHTLGVKSNCRLKHMFERNFPLNYLINVLPELPKLTITTSLSQMASFTGTPNTDGILTTASLTLFNGETRECTITLMNTSTIAINFIELSWQSTSVVDANIHKRIFQWSNEELQSKLPIKPNESIDVTLKIFGDADFLGPITNTVGGGGGGGASNIFDGNGPVSLNNLSVNGGGQSRISSPINHHLNRRTELTSSFRSNNSVQSSLGTTTLSLGGVFPRQFDTQLRIRYSGGQSTDLPSEHCRQCGILFNIELLPSAQIINWDVLPAEIQTDFYLVLDVINLTSQEMSLNYTRNKNILIESKESCRVPVPVKRCPLERIISDIQRMKQENLDNHQQISILSGSGNEIDLTERSCSEHIAEQVDLKWTLSNTETNGIATVKGISLSPTMLDLVTVAPLQWEVFIDNTSVPPQSEVTCSAGQCITLGISICNLLSTPLQQLTLSIQFYQDYQNGIHNYRLETRVTMSGPNQILIPILNKNEKTLHECSVIFFTPGRYKADIQCCSLNSSTSPVIINQLPAIEQNHQQILLNDNGAIESHVWRFIPPVEITVVE